MKVGAQKQTLVVDRITMRAFLALLNDASGSRGPRASGNAKRPNLRVVASKKG